MTIHVDVKQPAAERTVVAWNGLANSRPAIDWAVRREALRAGTVVIVRVVRDALVEAVEADAGEDLARVAAGGLEREVARLSLESPTIHFESDFVRGDPYACLLRFTNPRTVLVLGTDDLGRADLRRPGLFRPLSLGARLVPEARGPVVVVPGKCASLGRGVVVGVDGSATSQAAARFGAEEAQRSGGELLLVHAWQEPGLAIALGDIPTDFAPTSERFHRAILTDAVDEIRASFPDLVVSDRVVREQTARALGSIAANASMLVLGSRGLNRTRGEAAGSVSADLLDALPCPVVIIGPTALGTFGTRSRDGRPVDSLQAVHRTSETNSTRRLDRL